MAKAKKQENAEVTEPAKKPKVAKPAEEISAAAATEAPAPKAKKSAAKSAKPEAATAAADAPAAKAQPAKPATKAAAKTAEKTTTAKPADKAAAKPATAAPAKTESKPAQAKPSGTPASNPYFSGIDTTQAARAAASVVANRELLGGLGSSKPEAGAAKPEQKVESNSFKNLKQSLNRPAGLGKLFGGGDSKKGGLPFGSAGGGSLRNQTGSANKMGVPRRTNG